ncbi:hypothetical protein ANTPLA_LOCUS681 [Anthophora plagiata]
MSNTTKPMKTTSNGTKNPRKRKRGCRAGKKFKDWKRKRVEEQLRVVPIAPTFDPNIEVVGLTLSDNERNTDSAHEQNPRECISEECPHVTTPSDLETRTYKANHPRG